jgi:YggT family protein
VFDLLYTVARWGVFGCFAVTGIIAATHWAVQSRHLTPFGPLPRTVRRLGDPLVRWMERRMLRAGGNPSRAPYWLFGLSVVGGVALLAVLEWLFGFLTQLQFASQSPAGLGYFLVHLVFQVLMISILVRVIGSWVGVSEYAKWMRPMVVLTEWLLAPLRKIVPPFGMFDVTPFVAYILLLIAERLVLGLF